MSTPSHIRKYAKGKHGGGKLSRQRRWQLARIRDGKCKICGKPRGKDGAAQHCAACWKTVKERMNAAIKKKRAEKKLQCEKAGVPYRRTLKEERAKAARVREKHESEFLTEAEVPSTKVVGLR